ncbi:MAG: hypothetical protein HZA50_19710 [Planctomycetes bacterium]|nr:hypothetical protein [Planctomycetota bacterium]
MGCFVGIDIGAISAKAALLVAADATETHPVSGGENLHFMGRSADGRWLVYIGEYRRTRGKPIAATRELLEEIISAVGADRIKGVCLTGSGSKLTAGKLEAAVLNEFKAVAMGFSVLGVEAKTVFEMGGESSKYLRLARNADGTYGIVDYATNGDCAAGTGSFIDQQAGRLKYAVEDIGQICLSAQRPAQVAGRCSVFAKSDMIHAQQKGYTPAEVLRGLCTAVARNFRTAVARSHGIEPPVAFIGGVAANTAVVGALRETFGLDESQLFVPPAFSQISAIGAALAASRADHASGLSRMGELRAASDLTRGVFPTTEPLNMSSVMLLRDKIQPYQPPAGGKIDAFMGIDIGSVSTNVVVIDRDGRMVKEIYVRTQGRPIEVVSDSLKEVQLEWGSRLNILGVGTTGSGRELIGELIGADTVNDEITAHKTGAMYVGNTMLGGRVPDTIFEIGGQDAKFISLQDGVVVDFTMNEACAAGTGSFLEERAEELDISIKGEFASMALSSKAPVRLGERCTVFMERDVNNYMQRGAEKPDLVAGLAFSVVYNYINRVVRGRKIGDCIFFQGGTAYNDAVAAAFAAVTGKEIIVPPHNGVIGAIGSALLARDKMAAGAQHPHSMANYIGKLQADTQAVASASAPAAGLAGAAEPVAASAAPTPSRFRGYDISQVDYTLREFTCRGCSNACQIQEFNVEGAKTYWGDKCSDRYRKQARTLHKPVIEDLMALRMKLLMDEQDMPSVPAGAPTVGIPFAMFAWETLPFWRTMMACLGLKPVLSDPTNKKIVQAGLETVVAEPCFPIIVAHGHVANLAEKNPDFIWMPNILSQATQWMEMESHLCPWHQTLPFVVRRSPMLEKAAKRFLTPTIMFRLGQAAVIDGMQKFFSGSPLAHLKGSRVENACRRAYAAQQRFHEQFLAAGAEAMATLERTGEIGMVLIGRPYNIHDTGVNLSVAQKLREYYGVNCLPLDCLDTRHVDIRDINDAMYWDLGRKILATAMIVGSRPNLHVIYITNFKCGPDSFLKHYIRPASGKPFLSLQFDGHSNDAGMMTRCEAYLDSKGFLRPWSRQKQQPVAEKTAASCP